MTDGTNATQDRAAEVMCGVFFALGVLIGVLATLAVTGA